MSILLTTAEFVSDAYMGGSGTKAESAVQLAIDLAEGSVGEALGYIDIDGDPGFLTNTWTEEHKWPHPNRPLMLDRPRIQSVTTVTSLHDLNTCDCEWTELTACAYLFDARRGIVKFEACRQAQRCWSVCRCPHRIRVTYVAGFTAAEVAATTQLGKRLRLIIALQARYLLELQDFWTEGNPLIKSYSSLGYSESRDVIRTTLGDRLGTSLLCEDAARLLKSLIVRRRSAIVIRSQ